VRPENMYLSVSRVQRSMDSPTYARLQWRFQNTSVLNATTLSVAMGNSAIHNQSTNQSMDNLICCTSPPRCQSAHNPNLLLILFNGANLHDWVEGDTLQFPRSRHSQVQLPQDPHQIHCLHHPWDRLKAWVVNHLPSGLALPKP